MANLSPAAQAVSRGAQSVLDAVCSNTEPDCDTQHLIAAALRAAADQAKETPWPGRIESVGAMWMRDRLLAIADELEAP